MADISNWSNKNTHVDTQIDYKNFLSSARVVLYVASVNLSTSSDGSTTYTTQTYVPIGVIQGYSFAEQRQIEQIFEIGSDIPYIVPGRTMGQLNLSRILLNGKDLANVLYHGSSGGAPIPQDQVVRTLKDINRPFDFLFAAFSNETSDSGEAQVIFSRLFRNCWINSRQESIAANQTIVAENVTITYQDMPAVTISGVGPKG